MVQLLHSLHRVFVPISSISRLDNHVLATTIPPPCHHLSHSKHVLTDCVSKPRCHNVQCPESDQNSLGGIVLLLPYEKETILIANAGSFASLNVSVDHGESSANGYTDAFVLDECTRWKHCGEVFNHVESLLATSISWSCSNYDCLLPLGSSGGNHTKELAGGESKCAIVHRRAVCCIHSYLAGDIHNE